MPKPDFSQRVIANDLPSKTYSRTVFDLPERKDVIQTTIPSSVTRTFETSTDPRFPPKREVAKVTGTLYHGTGSTDSKVLHGVETSFLQKKSRKCKRGHNFDKKKIICKPRTFAIDDALAAKKEGMKHAEKSYNLSDAVLNSISLPTPHMVLDVKTLNKKEHSDLNLYDNNQTRKKRIEFLRKTPAGVRAAHTPRRFA